MAPGVLLCPALCVTVALTRRSSTWMQRISRMGLLVRVRGQEAQIARDRELNRRRRGASAVTGERLID